MKTSFFLAALLLAGCGGGRDSDPLAGADDVRTAASPAAAPITAAAAYFSGVPRLPARQDDGEPVPLDAVAAAPMDGLEPQPLN